MSLSGISGGNCTNAVGQYGSTYQSSATNRQSTTESTRQSEPPLGGSLIGAIMQSLSQIGVGQTNATDNSDTSASSDSGSTAQNAIQAFGDFMQNLMAALHSQGAAGGPQGGPPPGGPPPGGGNSGPNGGGGNDLRVGQTGSASGQGQLNTDLASLISQLTSSDSSTESDTGTSSDNTSLSGLEQSFSTLLNALGGSRGTTTLESFLETLASKLQSNGPSGNVINTQA
jgi:hypothetical protein